MTSPIGINPDVTLQMIDSAVHIDEETNEDITNRNVGRSDQHTKRLKNDN